MREATNWDDTSDDPLEDMLKFMNEIEATTNIQAPLVVSKEEYEYLKNKCKPVDYPIHGIKVYKL